MTNPTVESLKIDAGEVATIHGFVEDLSLKHNKSIQSDNWGMGCKISMEGVVVYFNLHGNNQIVDFHTYL